MSKPTYNDIPLSDITRKNMSLNIDDLVAISRLLSLQDDVYEEQFAELTSIVASQTKMMGQIFEEVKILRTDITELAIKVDRLEKRMGKVTKDINDTRSVVSKLRKDHDQLRKEFDEFKSKIDV